MGGAELLRTLDGFLATRLLYVAAKLGVPDALGAHEADAARDEMLAAGAVVYVVKAAVRQP